MTGGVPRPGGRYEPAVPAPPSAAPAPHVAWSSPSEVSRPEGREILRAPFTARAWRGTASALVGVLIAVLAFALVVPLTVAGVVLLPVLFLGSPLLWAATGLARVFGHLERARVRGLGEADVEASPLDGRFGVLGSPFRLLRSADRRRELAYCFVRLPVAGALAALIVVAWTGGLTVTSAVLFAGHPDPGPLLVVLVLIPVFFFTAPWIVRLASLVDVLLVTTLLGPSAADVLTAEVSTLRTSRAGVLDAADAERRRIERDLHDGAQQRLVALAMSLGVARARLDAPPATGGAPAPDAERDPERDPEREEVRRLVVRAHEDAKGVLAELRGLVRGIHPAVLEDRGLDAALSALAARCPVPVEVRTDVPERPHASTEAAAYFVVAEVLTNVARHAQARTALVDVRRSGDMLTVRVEDDGCGGADPSRGTGLAGLAHRVEALDGRFTLTSPRGGPTRIVAEVPCG